MCWLKKGEFEEDLRNLSAVWREMIMGKPSQNFLKKLKGWPTYLFKSGILFQKLIGGTSSLEEPGGRRLIHSVTQGMQITAMPIDPELAAKGKPNSLIILKARPTHTQKEGPEEMLTEHKETTLAQEMLTKFEKECKKLDAAWEMLEKLEAEMREHENLDYWECRRN
ncbi:hypothetical protein DUI87_26239 [Hirundo rustica rustica]|uniref:Uncharacterized protein n=1 Tax=Hirundo rustica rustica TaxID=333673 RepID=A0A3M0JAI8_HIRRU|nr:hypothetical protein DUI87_26239 [Hirundo rustica rustica]